MFYPRLPWVAGNYYGCHLTKLIRLSMVTEIYYPFPIVPCYPQNYYRCHAYHGCHALPKLLRCIVTAITACHVTAIITLPGYPRCHGYHRFHGYRNYYGWPVTTVALCYRNYTFHDTQLEPFHVTSEIITVSMAYHVAMVPQFITVCHLTQLLPLPSLPKLLPLTNSYRIITVAMVTPKLITGCHLHASHWYRNYYHGAMRYHVPMLPAIITCHVYQLLPLCHGYTGSMVAEIINGFHAYTKLNTLPWLPELYVCHVTAIITCHVTEIITRP
ncbi:hypothetical protein FQR65_LT12624 [Abscondita terminalis]|nr:hypothetical protein FQR65_LT12624 [Abscondita terminalis]